MLKLLLTNRKTILLALGLVLAACRLIPEKTSPPLPLSQRVTWEGKAALAYAVDSSAAAGDAASGAVLRLHRFEFGGMDTVRLLLEEYSRPYWAYAAFQAKASPQEMAEGFLRARNALLFRHGSFVGELQYARAGLVPVHFLKESLVFQGEELFRKPEEFATFPLLGRIANSDRVISRHFLGRDWNGPVFSVAYRCHQDTATAFRALPQNTAQVKEWLSDWTGKKDTLSWGKEVHFQGLDEFRRPLIFWIFPEGVMGFEGCFDALLAQEYAEKMEKTKVLWAKP